MKIQKKGLAAICALSLCVVMLSGCGGNRSTNSGSVTSASPPTAPSSQISAATSQEPKAIVRIGALQGPTGLGLVELMEKNNAKEAGNIYEFALAGAPDEITGKIINGELDIAAVPTNLASVLYGKTEGKVKIIAVNTLGVLYMMQKTEGDTVTSVANLKGETIYSTGQGATQEYVLNYLLTQNGMDPQKDVTVIYKSAHDELAALVAEGTAQLALLPQPFVTAVTMKDDSILQALDISKEWEDAAGTQLPMGCLIVRSEFLEKNQDAMAIFLEEYKTSTDFVNANVEEAAVLSGKFEVIREEVAKKAIPACNIVCIQGEDMKTAVGPYLDILFAADPKSVGGNVPDDPFYYIP